MLKADIPHPPMLRKVGAQLLRLLALAAREGAVAQALAPVAIDDQGADVRPGDVREQFIGTARLPKTPASGASPSSGAANCE